MKTPYEEWFESLPEGSPEYAWAKNCFMAGHQAGFEEGYEAGLYAASNPL